MVVTVAAVAAAAAAVVVFSYSNQVFSYGKADTF